MSLGRVPVKDMIQTREVVRSQRHYVVFGPKGRVSKAH